ncbi:MAG TPA: mycofactocin biosynthesis glycosyltransferase MftF [Ktedonobacteraceae bacterium]|nr:mycofactocin biosynthesis glycosyltransferase MftF [Ktedonobacteraceae bacterium]
MKTPSTHVPPPAGHYRLARGLRVRADHVICEYPLRVFRPGPATLRLLEICAEARSPGELAAALGLPLKRVEQLCEQLRWRGLLEAGPPPPPQKWPGVSIVIPTYNRAEQLERCLRALLQLEYPPEMLEIIVVDDCSTDQTAAIFTQLAPSFTSRGITLQFLRHTLRQGAAQCRNNGAEAARFDLLAFLDSDCVVTHGWLTALVPAFADLALTAAGGQLRAWERRSLSGRYEDRKSSLNMGAQPQRVTFDGPLTYLPTANLLVRREALRKIGGFALMPFGEDVDVCRRLLLEGAHILYLPQSIVLHEYRTSLPAFLHTRVSYASSEAVLQRLHPATRRVLLLPPEQATFAGMAIGGLWGLLRMEMKRRGRAGVLALLTALLITLIGAGKRLRGARRLGIGLHPLSVLRATLRGNLAYTYHLCRHITRYYTLPLLAVGIIVPPLLLLLLILCGIVIGVDYTRLRPNMRLGQFAICSLLDDCAYEVGVALGCVRQRTWMPLIPIVRKKL